MKTPTIACHLITADLDQILAAMDRIEFPTRSFIAWREARTRIYSLRERLAWLITHSHYQFEQPTPGESRQREFNFEESNAILAREIRPTRAKTRRTGHQRRFSRCVLDGSRAF